MMFILLILLHISPKTLPQAATPVMSYQNRPFCSSLSDTQSRKIRCSNSDTTTLRPARGCKDYEQIGNRYHLTPGSVELT